MRGFRTAAVLAVGLMACSVAIVVSSCNGSPTAGLADSCSNTSDCNSLLACAFARCHKPCTESQDCPARERCLSNTGHNVCQLAAEQSCDTAPCPTGLVCTPDLQCRSACSSAQPCPSGQSCVSGSCYDPIELQDTGANDSDLPFDATANDDPGLDIDSAGPDATLAPDGPFVPNADAGPLGFTVSNFSAAGVDAGDAGGDWRGAQAGILTTMTCDNTCLPASPVTIQQNDVNGTLADLYVLKSLTLGATTSLALSGPRPIILAVLTTVDIQGQLIVTAGGFSTPGAPGPGVGQGGASFPNSAPGGGSYCGKGGHGSASAPPAAAGGTTYGSSAVTPLVGGSTGGMASADGGNGCPLGARGGGALQIVAGTSIAVGQYGAINAGGGGGIACAGGVTGGGSGGAILLEAPTVTIRGNLAANGGGAAIGRANGSAATADDQPAPGAGYTIDAAAGLGGGGSASISINGGTGISGSCSDNSCIAGGGGGAGRIRINTASGRAVITGIVSPDLTTACATQGTIH